MTKWRKLEMTNSFFDFISNRYIQVPRLQREFAFGREDNVSREKRTRFIDTIFNSIIKKEPLYLNFVYGTSNGEAFVPLDGQQRLTILFLLHWYFIKKNKSENFLLDSTGHSRFMYDTRYSSTVFFQELTKFEPEDSYNLMVKQVRDMPWFELAWENDANIAGCLTVLDYIDKKAKSLKDDERNISVDDLKVITFDEIDIEAYEMSDDIYIKINSRGKQLTEFENFKAAFLEKVKSLDSNIHKYISEKFDNDWTRVFWQLVDFNSKLTPAEQLDSMMFNYIRYIAQVLIWEKSIDTSIDVNEGYSLISNVSKIFRTVEDFIEFEKWFDIFVPFEDIEAWCNDRFYQFSSAVVPNDTNKIRLWQDPNLLKNLTTGTTSRSSEALFYGLAVYLMNQESIDEKNFLLRFRSVRNFLEAGAKNAYNNTLRYSESANDMEIALKQIKNVILGVDSSEVTENSRLRKSQIEYEEKKNTWILENPTAFETIVMLEDNDKIRGNTINIGFENTKAMRRYAKLVGGDNLFLTRSLLSFGYQFPVKSKETTYFPTNTSPNSTFFRSKIEKDNNLVGILNANGFDVFAEISDDFINQCEQDSKYNPEYYAVKYPKYYIENNGQPYQYGNVRKFRKIGQCLTNKSNVQWFNFRNSILLTVMDQANDLRVEWLEDNSGLTWDGDKVLKSTTGGFELTIGENKTSIVVYDPDGNYDVEDRVKKGVHLILNS